MRAPDKPRIQAEFAASSRKRPSNRGFLRRIFEKARQATRPERRRTPKNRTNLLVYPTEQKKHRSRTAQLCPRVVSWIRKRTRHGHNSRIFLHFLKIFIFFPESNFSKVCEVQCKCYLNNGYFQAARRGSLYPSSGQGRTG